jgi:ribosome-associated toxin RatA of RatAB toxin-antitoxin module
MRKPAILRSRIEIAIDAPAARVFELARDVSKWPTLLPHYRRVTVLSHDATSVIADMRAVRSFGRVGIAVGWRARYWSEASHPDDLRLRFVHVGGPTRGMDVTWHITPDSPVRSTAAIEHDFRRRLPLLGEELFPRIVDRLFVRPIAGRTLATFKRLAEQRSASA